MAYGSVKVDNIIFDNGGVDKLITVSGLFFSTSGALTVTGTISGGNVTAPTATFTTLTGTTTAGTAATFTSGSFTSLTGVTTTGTTATFTSGSFTSLTGVTTTVTSGVFSSGIATAPSVAIGSGTTYKPGIYSPGTDQVGISTGGTGRVFVDASGNLGVGGLPQNDATYGGFTLNGANGSIITLRAGGVNSGRIYTTATDNINIDGNGSASTNIFFRTGTGSIERMRIDSSGNVGIGVVPSATAAAYKSIELFGSVWMGGNGTTPATYSMTNAYFDGSYKYKTTGFAATYYGQDTGSHKWFTAPSGTAGNAISFTQAMTLDASGRLGIGTTSPVTALQVVGTGTFGDGVGGRLQVTTNSNLGYIDSLNNTSTQWQPLIERGTEIQFHTNTAGVTPTQKAVIDSSGRLLVGTSISQDKYFNTTGNGHLVQIESTSVTLQSSTVHGGTNAAAGAHFTFARSRGITTGSVTAVASGDNLARLSFQGADGTEFVEAATITCDVDGTPGANDMPGRLVFSTTADGAASPTERMRVTNDGNVTISSTAYTSARLGIGGYANGDRLGVYMRASTDPATPFDFRNAANTTVGSIATTASATAFNTSSDYRLKENVTPITNGITRFQQLKPSQFNFIADPGHTVDGFLAHEAQAVVPECVTGTKDAVDADGNPVYQGIDQSKLVPLLTAALQEAIAKIEALEASNADMLARVTALEGN
jgi:hypothetical protein